MVYYYNFLSTSTNLFRINNLNWGEKLTLIVAPWPGALMHKEWNEDDVFSSESKPIYFKFIFKYV